MFTYRKAHIVRYSCCICIDAINSYLLTLNRLHGLSTLFKFDLPFSLVAFLRRLGFHVFLCGQRFLATFAIFRDQVSKELFPFCNSVSHISVSMTTRKREMDKLLNFEEVRPGHFKLFILTALLL